MIAEGHSFGGAPLPECHHIMWWVTSKMPQGQQSASTGKQAGRDCGTRGEHMAPQRGSRHPALVHSSEPRWMLSPELVLNVKSDFWKRERMTGREEAGIPEISLGEGRLGTYQRGHPLKDVDTLPVIDVVRLPTLRGTGGERGGQAPAHRLPPPSCSEQLPWEESWPATSPGDRPGQCPLNSGLTRL